MTLPRQLSLAVFRVHLENGLAVAVGVGFTGLLAGGLSALAFIVGQLAAWRELVDAGYFVAANPANTFFYLLTAVHGLHLTGGLAALVNSARVATSSLRTSSGNDPSSVMLARVTS